MSLAREIKSLVRRVVQSILAEEMRTHIPCRVEAYDDTTNTCELKPCIKVMRSQDPNSLTSVELTVLKDVPVLQNGSGKLLLARAPQAGSYGVAHVSDRAIDVWLNKGGVVDAGSARRFDLSDVFFEPGLYHLIPEGDNGLIEVPVATDRISLRTRAGTTEISVLDDDSIELTTCGDVSITADGDATVEATGTVSISGAETVLQDGTDFAVQFAAMKSAFDTLVTDLNNFVTWATTHVHPGVLAGAASTAVAAPPPVSSAANMDGAKIDDVRVP